MITISVMIYQWSDSMTAWSYSLNDKLDNRVTKLVFRLYNFVIIVLIYSFSEIIAITFSPLTAVIPGQAPVFTSEFVLAGR